MSDYTILNTSTLRGTYAYFHDGFIHTYTITVFAIRHDENGDPEMLYMDPSGFLDTNDHAYLWNSTDRFDGRSVLDLARTEAVEDFIRRYPGHKDKPVFTELTGSFDDKYGKHAAPDEVDAKSYETKAPDSRQERINSMSIREIENSGPWIIPDVSDAPSPDELSAAMSKANDKLITSGHVGVWIPDQDEAAAPDEVDEIDGIPVVINEDIPSPDVELLAPGSGSVQVEPPKDAGKASIAIEKEFLLIGGNSDGKRINFATSNLMEHFQIPIDEEITLVRETPREIHKETIKFEEYKLTRLTSETQVYVVNGMSIEEATDLMVQRYTAVEKD